MSSPLPDLVRSATSTESTPVGLAEAVPGGSGATDPPYLSIVVTTRNDNHGGDLLFRTQVFLNALFAQFNRFSIPAELIVVEWNPPDDRPRLVEALSWPEDFGCVSVRIIEVPETLHRTFRNADRLPLFQMIAKNVGIRRATGDFVLATNIDIVFSNELMQFLARRRLQPGRFYRTDRFDVDGVATVDAPIELQLEACEESVIRVCGRYGTQDLRTGDFYRIWLKHERLPWWLALFVQAMLFVSVRLQRALTSARPGRGGPSAGMLRTAVGLARLVSWPVRAGSPPVLRATARVGRRVGEALRALTRPYFWRRCRFVVLRPRLWPRAGRAGLRFVGDGVRSPGSRLRNGVQWRFQLAERVARERVHASVDRFRDAVVWARALPALHTNACGDFTLMATDDWLTLRAYPELQLFSMFIDSIFIYMAYWKGFREAFLPCRIYHLEHAHGFKPDAEGLAQMNERLEKFGGVPQIDDAKFRSYAIEMYRLRGPIQFNDEDWGLAGEDLPERGMTAPMEEHPAASGSGVAR